MEDLKEKEALKEKVEKLKQEVEKAKKDYQDIFYAFYDSQYTEGANRYIRIKSDFIMFLKDKIDKTKIKQLKETVINNSKYNRKKKYYTPHHLSIIKYALEIIEQYKNEYEKQELTTELCKLTNCLEKLTPTKTCQQCKSEYPKEAKFCPACGCELYKKPTKEEQNAYNNLTQMMGLRTPENNTKTDGSKLNLTSSIISDIISDQWSYSTINEPTIPKVEKGQEAKKPLCPTCDYYDTTTKYCNYFNRKIIVNTYICGNYQKKILCNSCTYYGECDHPDLTECDQYEEAKKEETEWMHIIVECKNCKHLHSLGNGTSYCNKGFSVKLIEKGNCKYYEASNKESTQCPYFDKCNSTIKKVETAVCYNYEKHIEFIKVYCVDYIQFEKEKNRCPYYEQCSYFLKNSEICTNVNINDNSKNIGCAKYYDFKAKSHKNDTSRTYGGLRSA